MQWSARHWLFRHVCTCSPFGVDLCCPCNSGCGRLCNLSDRHQGCLSQWGTHLWRSPFHATTSWICHPRILGPSLQTSQIFVQLKALWKAVALEIGGDHGGWDRFWIWNLFTRKPSNASFVIWKVQKNYGCLFKEMGKNSWDTLMWMGIWVRIDTWFLCMHFYCTAASFLGWLNSRKLFLFQPQKVNMSGLWHHSHADNIIFWQSICHCAHEISSISCQNKAHWRQISLCQVDCRKWNITTYLLPFQQFGCRHPHKSSLKYCLFIYLLYLLCR